MISDDLWITVLKLASVPLRGHDLGKLIDRFLKEIAGPCTVSGLIIQKLGRFARPGDVFTIDGSELRVEEVAGTRITKIKFTRPHQAARTASRNIKLSIPPADLRQLGAATARPDHSQMEHAA